MFINPINAPLLIVEDKPVLEREWGSERPPLGVEGFARAWRSLRLFPFEKSNFFVWKIVQPPKFENNSAQRSPMAFWDPPDPNRIPLDVKRAALELWNKGESICDPTNFQKSISEFGLQGSVRGLFIFCERNSQEMEEILLRRNILRVAAGLGAYLDLIN